MQKPTFWTHNKITVLLIIVAYFLFLMELRLEHSDEFGDHWQAWIPLVYSAIMVVIGIWGLWFWRKAGRKVLFWTFGISIIVGLLGVWFHDKGKPWKSVTVIAEAWQTPILKKHKPQGGETALPQTDVAAEVATPKDTKKKKKKPKPPLAPLAFAGIGILGMLACRKEEMSVL